MVMLLPRGNPAWMMAMLLAVLTVPAANSQILRQRYPGRTDCPDTHLRLTARHRDGSPAAGLRPQDLYLWLSLGSAEIRSMKSEEPSHAGAADTNVLIVIRPQGGLDAGMVDAVLRSLQATPNFQWKIAVLAPDGTVSPFVTGTDRTALQAALTHAGI